MRRALEAARAALDPMRRIAAQEEAVQVRILDSLGGQGMTLDRLYDVRLFDDAAAARPSSGVPISLVTSRFASHLAWARGFAATTAHHAEVIEIGGDRWKWRRRATCGATRARGVDVACAGLRAEGTADD